jgi:hypothetical protein
VLRRIRSGICHFKKHGAETIDCKEFKEVFLLTISLRRGKDLIEIEVKDLIWPRIEKIHS